MSARKDPERLSVEFRHAKSVADWPYECYCTCCGEEWPCTFARDHMKRQPATGAGE